MLVVAERDGADHSFGHDHRLAGGGRERSRDVTSPVQQPHEQGGHKSHGKCVDVVGLARDEHAGADGALQGVPNPWISEADPTLRRLEEAFEGVGPVEDLEDVHFAGK